MSGRAAGLTARAALRIVVGAPLDDLMADAPQVPDPSTPDSGGLEERLYARTQELAETQERARLGGLFYPVSWLLACSVAGFAAPIAWAVGALFVALAYLRFHLPQSRARTLEDITRALRWPWIVALTTTVLWGAVSVWAVLDPRLAGGRPVTLFATVAFSTAFAHSFPMRRAWSALAISLLVLPSVVAYASLGEIGLALMMLVFSAYVYLALMRSHREYVQRLTLEAALRSERDRYEQQSRRDGLTGLANRRRFVAALSDQVTRAREGDAPFSLVIMDLDQFKSINDRHGHAGGDRCLIAISAMLRAVYDGPGELPARLGGEEFAVLLPGHDVERAVARTESFRLRLGSTPIDLGAAQILLTTSAGVGAFDPKRHPDGDTLYGEVDQALYRAKAGGRNRVCAIEPASPPR